MPKNDKKEPVKQRAPRKAASEYEPMALRYPRTISEELFNVWTQLRRKNDTAELKKLLKLSVPIINRALKYGHVNFTWVEEKITEFFRKRLEKEAEKAQNLISLASQAGVTVTPLSPSNSPKNGNPETNSTGKKAGTGSAAAGRRNTATAAAKPARVNPVASSARPRPAAAKTNDRRIR